MVGNADACEAALRPENDESVLWVSYTRPTENCLDRLLSVPDDRKTVVDVGGGTRAAAAGTTATPTDGEISVAEPNDLTGLGIAIAEQLRDTDGVHVCFDSITAVLQYVETSRAYTFLNSLLGHLWDADAHAHFHLNPDAHDEETVAAITSLFDARVDVDDGTVVTRERS